MTLLIIFECEAGDRSFSRTVLSKNKVFKVVSSGKVGRRIHASTQVEIECNYKGIAKYSAVYSESDQHARFPIFTHVIAINEDLDADINKAVALGWMFMGGDKEVYSAWLLLCDDVPSVADRFVLSQRKIYPGLAYDQKGSVAVLAKRGGNRPGDHFSLRSRHFEKKIILGQSRNCPWPEKNQHERHLTRYDNHPFFSAIKKLPFERLSVAGIVEADLENNKFNYRESNCQK